MARISQKIIGILASRWFFIGVMVFFVISALWVALSSVYPMAFDEDFHLGVITVYSQQLSPFLPAQPETSNKFGALISDPSYFYHYLMSFPFRLVSYFTDNQATQVIFLRLINIALFGAGLVLFRKVMLRAGTSRALTHSSILIVILVPIVPLLAGQINYDNLLILLVAWICWLVLGLVDKLKSRQVDLGALLTLLLVCIFTSVVKYAFLPMAIAVVVFLAWMFYKTFRRHGKELGLSAKKSWTGLGTVTRSVLLVLLIVGSVLFLQRYGLNTVRYHSPVPDCGAVIGTQACLEYGPWGRNYRYAETKGYVNPNPLGYTDDWLKGLHKRLFFVINGPPSYTNHPPIPIPAMAAVLVAIFGILATIIYWRRVFREQPFLVFALVLSIFYCAALWLDTYTQYLDTGWVVAVNGRYLVPILLLIAIIWGRAFSLAIRNRNIKSVLVVVTLVMFLQGGGLFSFILYSDSNWYWPNRHVTSVNDAARKTIDPLILQGPKD